MRRILKKLLPDHSAVSNNRWLRPFTASLLHPRLWHLNRHSAAGGVAAGMFCGLIPGPFQMLGAGICALIFRINLPLALLTTLYTNPFTIVPLYLLAYELGVWATGSPSAFIKPPDFDWGAVVNSFTQLLHWCLMLGKPLAIGLGLLASSLAVISYFVVQASWRLYLITAWRQRQTQRHKIS